MTPAAKRTVLACLLPRALCLDPKPALALNSGVWTCAGSGHIGIGSIPEQAWVSWLAKARPFNYLVLESALADLSPRLKAQFPRRPASHPGWHTPKPMVLGTPT